MHKKLLSLAVAGALAAPGVALAQVEVYGFVNMSVGKFKYDSISTNVGLTNQGVAAGAGSVSKWDVASHASNYGIRGRENLGGGQTAWFQIEQNAPMERSNNTAITPASRNSAVGLQGGWGNLFIGQWTTPWADLDGLWAIGTVGGWGPVTSIIGRRESSGTAPNFVCSNLAGHGNPASCDAVEAGAGVGHALWRRASNSIHFQSPVFGGAQVKVMYQTNEGKSGGATAVAADADMWSGSVTWSGMGGRLRIGAAYDVHNDFSSIGKADKGWALKGGWNFGFADVGFAYETFDYALSTTPIAAVPVGSNLFGAPATGATYSGNDCKAVQWGLAIAIPVGSGAIRASYAEADDLEGVGCAAVIGFAGGAGYGGAKTYNIGYEHRFSKRTSIGFGYAAIDNNAGSATEPGGVHNWTGVPPNQQRTGGGGTENGPLSGGDMSTFFVNMIHRF